MKKLSSSIKAYLAVNPQEKVRVACLTLILFVIDAGAPDAGSGIIN